MSTDQKLAVTETEFKEMLHLLVILGSQTLNKPDTTVLRYRDELVNFAQAWLRGNLVITK